MPRFLLGLLMLLLLASCASNKENLENNDWYYISSKNELHGPDGLHTSCREIAESFSEDGGRIKHMLYEHDDSNKRREIFKSEEGLFNVKFINWSPAITEYLKNAVDSCVANRNSVGNVFHSLDSIYGVREGSSSIRLYPLKAKQLLENVSEVALATRKFFEEKPERDRLAELQKKKQELADIEWCKGNNMCYCSNVGSIYRMAADIRDSRGSPETAFLSVGAYRKIVDDKVVKQAINKVFFDSKFSYASGSVFERQMMNACLGNVRTYKPLE